ncbi:MAG: DUF262 domain-containing HNH endonuclease family protein [Candidatus Bathyarchaeota archaeon]|nr:DUF262 domain-containing HNH endonuclease family protein [Candidatus Bathyarchaeota archaeon]
MSYRPISIREAIERVNETWYLPAIQRPYDWGERTKKELFIYKLFDSVIREYPIGTLIVWETSKPIPFRPFLDDYDSEKLMKIVDKGLWGRKDKLLIYDGQQRLQSLYSCLKFTFHNQVLCYNLLFNPKLNQAPSGFKFFPKNEDVEIGYIRMNEVYSANPKEWAEFEDKTLEGLRKSKGVLSKEEEILVKNNLKQLWRLFVDRDIQLVSYYPLRIDMGQTEVLDVFKRINTTGMTLTKSEILFSGIKNIQFDFEEQIWEANLEIKEQTGGFSVGPDNILQVLHLLVKGTVRVDPDRVSDSELAEFVSVWPLLESPLKQFFYDFLYRQFRITDERIVGSKRTMIPLIAYFYYMRTLNQSKFKDFSPKSISYMKKYLTFSQLLDWSLQGHVDNFSRIVKAECEKKESCDFPFQKLRDWAQTNSRRRRADLEAEDLNSSNQQWFVLKIITPDKAFTFLQKADERFNPEIDHIFPWTPEQTPPHPERYYKWISTVWNLQPVKGEINGLKLNMQPKDFFEKYPEYLKDYDFLPTKDLTDKRWSAEYADEFIQARRRKIILWVKENYGINIKP